MKTKIKGVLAILFALFMFSSIDSKAQCAKINNTTRCSFKVVVTVYQRNQVTGICNVVCNSFSNTVPPGGSIPVNCACSNVCNISVQVVAINGVSIAPVTIDYQNGPQPLPGNPCGATVIRFDPSVPAFIFQ